MKKLFLLILPFLLMRSVYADTDINLSQLDFIPYSSVNSYLPDINSGVNLSNKYYYTNFNEFYSKPEYKTIFNNLWDALVNADVNNSGIEYYHPLFSISIISKSSTVLDLYSVTIVQKFDTSVGNYGNHISVTYYNGTYYYNVNGNNNISLNGYSVNFSSTVPHWDNANPFIVGVGDFSSSWFYLPTSSFMNYYDYFNQAPNTNFYIYDGSNLIKTVSYGDQLPVLFGWNEFNPSSSYTEVNLDNYRYVILSLKNYSYSSSFQSDLFVKGQIGITPVYNYGQTSKDAITGVQVQDRCNISYSNYTLYPFYILQSDLQNNAVYYVKSCASLSSFKFDNTIFDVTYVNSLNEENPTITIDGKTYNVIPYDDLPSSATENEENNYIPGQSGSATDIGGLDSVVKNAQNRLSEIWNTITYFTSFVGLLFSSLPSELSSILISAFVVITILGIIKLFVGH